MYDGDWYYGADIGMAHRGQGWLADRSLHVTSISLNCGATVPPSWAGGPAGMTGRRFTERLRAAHPADMPYLRSASFRRPFC